MFGPHDCNDQGQCCRLAFLAAVQGRAIWDNAAEQLIRETECEGCGDA